MSQAEAAPPRVSRQPSRRRIGRLMGAVAVLVGSLGAGAVIGLAFSLSRLPDVDALRHYAPAETSEIFDYKGRLIAKIHDEENRSVVHLGQISPWLQKAVVSAEDDRFWTHPGVDIRGLIRGTTADIRRRGHATGGSTLTQQLARNLFLTPERALSRKLAEAYLSIQIERRYAKNQILELYLNQVYWGHNAYGCEAASQMYFGKSSAQLNLAEAAMLAGIIPGPELFSPYHSLEKAKWRQSLVLNRMVELDVITPAEAEAAKAAPITLGGARRVYTAPYFTSYVLRILNERYGATRVREGGLRVTTTLDLDAQRHAEQLIRDELAKLKANRVTQGALVSIDNATGGIRALVGGVDFYQSQFNRATQALRPPGSSFKPFVYLTGFAEGYTPNSVEIDEPIEYPMVDGSMWRPNNYDHKFRGAITIRRALERSVNVVAIKILDTVTPKKVIETAHQFGLHGQLQENLSLALGTGEVTPLQLAGAYSGLANIGRYTPPTAILRVENRQGDVLEEVEPKPRQVFNSYYVAELVDCMRGVLLRGTGVGAYFGRPAAGKTGTSSDHRDAWFAGFTPQLATVVWVGNDDNSAMIRLTGGDVCAPIWGKFMRQMHQNLPVKDFPDPGSLPEADEARKLAKAKPKGVRATPSATPSPAAGGASKPPARPTVEPGQLQEIDAEGRPAGWVYTDPAPPRAARPTSEADRHQPRRPASESSPPQHRPSAAASIHRAAPARPTAEAPKAITRPTQEPVRPIVPAARSTAPARPVEPAHDWIDMPL